MLKKQFVREKKVRSDDPDLDKNAYMKELPFNEAGEEKPGDPTGFLRFVSF